MTAKKQKYKRANWCLFFVDSPLPVGYPNSNNFPLFQRYNIMFSKKMRFYFSSFLSGGYVGIKISYTGVSYSGAISELFEIATNRSE